METRRRNQAEQIALVEEQLASGQTVKEFCRQRGLNHFTFSSWRQRRAQIVRGEAVVEVTPEHSELPVQRQGKETPLRVVLGHATVEITGEVDEGQLEAVLRAVGRSSC